MLGDLDRLPGSPQMHRWADWAEAICLAEGVLSLTDLSDDVERNEESLAHDLDDDIEPDDRSSDALRTPFDSPDQFKDAVAQRASDAFAYIASRSQRFGDAYPFEIDLQLKQLTTKRRRQDRDLYSFLLVASALRYVPSKSDQTRIAGAFEWLALEAFRKELPHRAEVHLFGTNSVQDGRYNGALTDKIRLLSSDLRETVLVNLTEEFEAGDRGDNGLDLVGWVPSLDRAPGMLTAFGQCACTPKWVEKQHSSSKDAWEPLMRFTVDPVNYCFIPFDFRKPDGSWYARHSIHNSIVMDRGRIMSSLGEVSDTGSYLDEIDALLSLLPIDEIAHAMAG